MDMFVCVLILVTFGEVFGDDNVIEFEETKNCTGKEFLNRVDLSLRCSTKLIVHTAVTIFPTDLLYSVLPTCLDCTLNIETSADKQLTATMYSLGTETGPDGACDLNRLDIYDGDYADDEHRLTRKTGICGCNLPEDSVIKSTNNSLTLTFNTQCNNRTQHGEFDLVIAAVVNDAYNLTDCHGQFECFDGVCIDKNLVCDGHNNCPDGSDERDCAARINGTCPGQFECMSGQCIDKNLVCNGHDNCDDHSDETNCKARNGTCPGQFECTDGQCIDKNLVCDGKNNCKDKSDETNCKIQHKTLLLYVLIGLACLVFIFVLVISFILCCRYCCMRGQMATVYKRF